MKLMIASDLHGSAFYVEKLLSAMEREQPDKLILLGDLLYHGPRNDLPEGYAPKKVIEMLNGVKEKLLCIRGNCEAEVDQMVLPFPCMADYAMIEADGKLLYLTHGHLHHPDALPPLASGTVFLSGHTHVKMDAYRNGIRCLNPGSVSIPKDGSHSCLILEDGVFRFHIWED